MKNLALWGATGSIGSNTFEIIGRNRDQFNIKYLSFHKNWQKALELIEIAVPQTIIVTDQEAFLALKENINSSSDIDIRFGMQEMLDLSGDPEIDLVVNALVGEAGLLPTISALEAGNNVALANKESLVMAGEIITRLSAEKKATVFPIDSEHSAIWQCLAGEPDGVVRKIILTASGGPFRSFSGKQLENVKVEDALKHPNWSMGKKITIDSATLMNKGLEFIEAYWLYPVNEEQIDIVIHPQSIIHSLVEFVDGSLKAQLGFPDMKIPIQYALTYPNRLELKQREFNLADIGKLTFEKVNYDLFPALNLAKFALQKGGISTAVLNVANEYAVYAFIDKKIPFLQIAAWATEAVEKAPSITEPGLDDILAAANWARNFINEKLGETE